MSQKIRTEEEAAAYASTKRCVLVGCAYNVERHLFRVLDGMEKLGRVFADYRIVVMENGSRDRTRKYLDSLAVLYPRVEVHTATGVPFTQQSSKRLAHIRQLALEVIRERYSDWDYVIPVDMDEVGAGDPDPAGLVTCFMWGGWAFMAPAHRPYYDRFALRLADGASYPGNIFDKVMHCARRGGDALALQNAMFAPHFKFVVDLEGETGPVRVRAAFCARALYPLPEYIRCRYSDEPRYCDEEDDCLFPTDCEHVSVCDQLVEATGCAGYVNGRWRPASWEG